MINKKLPHVVVIGAGFGGIELCKQLQDTAVRISLIDKHNYHLFQPLLYQVASAALSPAEIAYPIRTIFRDQSNVQVYLEEATKIDLLNKKVIMTDEECSYDYLVIAAGARHSYFGNDEWQQWAPGLKSIDDATEIRKKVLIAFEEAEYEADEVARKAKLTFVIVGGGPTGVELAGALMEIAAKTIPDDFRNVDTSTARVILVHSGARILPSFAESLSQSALDALQQMGVEVLLNSKVTKVDAEGVMVGEQRVCAQNVFWAAGVQAASITKTLDVPLDKSGKIIVNPNLSLPGYPEVFAIGDIAAMVDAKSGKPVPAVAQGAAQSGRFVGQLIDKLVTKGTSQDQARFSYFDKGSMATIGKAKAVAQIGKLKFTGSIAWLLWSFVHVLFLVGFRNRITVVLAWVWNYLFSSRGARLITGFVKYSVKHIP
jgi:NADH:ubiquinone reductase (H+-translocating)